MNRRRDEIAEEPKPGQRIAKDGEEDGRVVSVSGTRRHFLETFSLLCGGIATAVVAVPVLGFVFAPLFRKTPRKWRDVGSVDQFKIGNTVEVSFVDPSTEPWSGVTAKTAAWLRREAEKEFIAFSINCTHLGCPVRWDPRSSLFLCPCHGGVYYSDGTVAAGPPPKALNRYAVRLRNGRVEVGTGPIPIT